MRPTTGRVVQVMLDSRSSHVQARFMLWGVLLISEMPPSLVGLRNKLMLKHDENSGNRLVVLPEGSVSYEKSSDHVRVIIDKDSTAKAHAYYVDDPIGRLVDNGSLQSKLLLCYLHALTSFCLPDPLIQRTGTEQALSILKSAAVRSFDRCSRRRVWQCTPGGINPRAREGSAAVARQGCGYQCPKPDTMAMHSKRHQLKVRIWWCSCCSKVGGCQSGSVGTGEAFYCLPHHV
jgi:hypothetical protein